MLFAGYTYECFSVLGKRRSAETQERIFGRQTALMYLLHLNAFAVMYAVTNEAVPPGVLSHAGIACHSHFELLPHFLSGILKVGGE